MNPRQQKLAEYQAINFHGDSPQEFLSLLAHLVDLASDLDSETGLQKAVQLCDEPRLAKLAAPEEALAHYFAANAWAGLRKLRRRDKHSSWDWEQPELEKELLHLRCAVLKMQDTRLEDYRKSQIYTNLGNALNHVGRPIEAIKHWDCALQVRPEFPMAKGNLAIGFFHYAKMVYDEGHRALLLKEAYRLLGDALDGRLHEEAHQGFMELRHTIEKVVSKEFLAGEIQNFDNFSLGTGKKERVYRQWCLANRLFLNPLNDAWTRPIAAHDVLHAPSVVLPRQERPFHYGFYNQLKQEFVAARFLCFQSQQSQRGHYSDRDVLLYDTLDYSDHGFRTEQLKLAFRAAYSILDKVAYFLNAYLKLGIPEHRVSFRTLWYDGQEQKRGLHRELDGRRNLPLRGLFWLSKDLFENREGFREAIAPDARELNDIRNHLEHKYLKLHDDLWQDQDPEASATDPISSMANDPLAYSLYRRDFAEKTLYLLRLARSALVNLSLTIHVEEQQRGHERGVTHKAVLSIPMTVIDDEWKL